MIGNKKWGGLDSRVSIIQGRIYKFSQKKNKKIVVFLQTKIINNLESKYFSMYQIFLHAIWKKINFLGKKSYFTLMEKIGLIRNLKIGEIRTKKVKRCLTKRFTPGHLKISVMILLQESIKQKLVLLGIEPEWEAKFTIHSYGFRKWCNIHFAIKAIFNRLKKFHGNVDNNTYILKFNLTNYVDQVDHSYILHKLKAIPQITKQIKFWLKRGILKNIIGTHEKNNQILPMQTSSKLHIIALFLINVAFHGIETNFKNWIINSGVTAIRKQQIKYNYLISIVRYLDSLLIIQTGLTLLNKINIFVTTWLKLNCRITAAKLTCKVSEFKRGFDFLGYRFIKIFKNRKIKISVYPTKKSQKYLVWLLGEKCRNFRGMTWVNLLDFLKLKMLSWACYFRYVECRECFKKLDYLIFLIVKCWLFKNNRQKEKKLINTEHYIVSQRYMFYGKPVSTSSILCFWSKSYKGNRIEDGSPNLSWINSLYFINCEGARTLDDWSNYWTLLTKKYGGFNGWQQKILQIAGKSTK